MAFRKKSIYSKIPLAFETYLLLVNRLTVEMCIPTMSAMSCNLSGRETAAFFEKFLLAVDDRIHDFEHRGTALLYGTDSHAALVEFFTYVIFYLPCARCCPAGAFGRRIY